MQTSSLSNNKEWFILVDQQQYGPYSLLDLKNHPFFTPDTFVWKVGFDQWVLARSVKELKVVFKDDEKAQPQFNPIPCDTTPVNSDLAEIAIYQDPYQNFFWLLIALAVILYAYFKIYP